MFQATQIQWPQLCIYPSGHMSVSLNEQWTHLALWVCCECTGSTYTPPRRQSSHSSAANLHIGTWAYTCTSPSTVSLPYTAHTHTQPVAQSTVSNSNTPASTSDCPVLPSPARALSTSCEVAVVRLATLITRKVNITSISKIILSPQTNSPAK